MSTQTTCRMQKGENTYTITMTDCGTDQNRFEVEVMPHGPTDTPRGYGIRRRFETRNQAAEVVGRTIAAKLLDGFTFAE